MSLAVGCGLHQIDIRSQILDSADSTCTPGASSSSIAAEEELEEETILAMRLWHSIFIVRCLDPLIPPSRFLHYISRFRIHLVMFISARF